MDFAKIATHECDVRSIIALEQVWTRGHEEFQYISRPRPDNGFILVLTDGAVYRQNGRLITPHAGDILYLPMGAYYSVAFTKLPARTLLVNFALYYEKRRPSRFSEEICPLAEGSGDRFEEDFRDIVRIYGNVVHNKLKLKKRFFDLLSSLAELCEAQTGGRSVAPALAFINNHLKSDISVPDLAKMCALNECTFRREFKKQMGVSCVKYMNEEKIRKARHVLRHETISVGQLAQTLGFHDESRFCKVFRSVTGMTPLQYRRSFDPKE